MLNHIPFRTHSCKLGWQGCFTSYKSLGGVCSSKIHPQGYKALIAGEYPHSFTSLAILSEKVILSEWNPESQSPWTPLCKKKSCIRSRGKGCMVGTEIMISISFREFYLSSILGSQGLVFHLEIIWFLPLLSCSQKLTSLCFCCRYYKNRSILEKFQILFKPTLSSKQSWQPHQTPLLLFLLITLVIFLLWSFHQMEPLYPLFPLLSSRSTT